MNRIAALNWHRLARALVSPKVKALSARAARGGKLKARGRWGHAGMETISEVIHRRVPAASPLPAFPSSGNRGL